MRNSLLSFALIVGLMLPMGAIHAQDTNAVTATCKDGTAFTGMKRSGACRGHGSVQSWGAASTQPAPWPHLSIYGNDEPAYRFEPRWRRRSGLGQYRQQGLSLPWYSVVWQDQARELHVRGEGEGTGR